ncbi:MAG: c-type cytochrome domain-containing protein [Terracidiphilus sp.]
MKIDDQLTGFWGRVLPKSKATRIAWGASILLSAALVSLPWLVRLDGNPHADWEQFLGRFHPLVVHLPIGFLLLVPVLEVAGRLRPELREAAGFVLGLSFASCLLALTLGVLLAYGSGNSGPAVTRHMAGGIALTIGVLACLLVRPMWPEGSVFYLYPALLACMLPLLLWTTHQGATLVYGSGYLTHYMPAGLKRWTSSNSMAPPDSFYAKQINPIFDSNCVACHGEGKAKGGLRLDSFEQLMKGGKDGAVVIAGDAGKSVLLQRVTLSSNQKQFMPAEGRPPLRAEEIASIKAWIQQGASPTSTTVAGISVRDERPELPLLPVGDYNALMPEIQQMAKTQGAKLMQVSSKPEDGLVLFTVDAASSFGDAQLAQFQKFGPYIVEAELGRTAVTDASFDTLKQFTHLRALHLEETHVSGDGLEKLTPLTQLTYLNLSGTQVTAEAVRPLSSMRNLRHVYLYNTPAQPAPGAEQAQPIARNTP